VEWRSRTIRRMLEKVRMSTLTMLRFHSRHPIWEQNIVINSGQHFQPVYSCNHKNKLNLKTTVFWYVKFIDFSEISEEYVASVFKE
jgi:hypothetical protein